MKLLKMVMMVSSSLFLIVLIGCAKPKFYPEQSLRSQENQDNLDKINQNCSLYLEKENLCAGLQWATSEELTSGHFYEFELRFWQKDQGSLSQGPYFDPSGSVYVQFWMPEHGHGIPKPVITKTQVGVYSFSKVYLIMSGKYEARIQSKKNNEVWDQSTYNFEVLK